MRKNSIAIINLAFLASCFMVSCSTEAFDTNQPVKGAKIVIPAQKMSTKAVAADGTATFKTTENVYILKSGSIDTGVIHPTDDAASTTLTGTLAGTYSQGEKITVLYNTNKSGVVDYSGQDGSIGSVKDAGYADNVEIVSYSGNVLTTTSATIENLQSIFKFTFYNGSISEDKKISGIRFVRVFSTNNNLVSSYDAISKSSTKGPITISRTTDLADNYIYAALRFNSNDGDEIVFQVVDNAGNVYSGSKVAPSTGFENGKIYNSNVVVNRYTFSTSASTKVCISPGDLGPDVFLAPFTNYKNTNSLFTGNDITNSLKNKTLYGVSAWHIPDDQYSGGELQNIYGSRTMSSGVSRWYKVKINDKYCILLPPDEATASDIESDLTSGSVTEYLKYLKKGFVLLEDTGGLLDSSWTTIYGTGIYRVQNNRVFFRFSSSYDPSKVNINTAKAVNYKVRVRLLHTVN